MTLLSTLLVGFLLGMKHATEADHLAAMATLTSGRQSLGQTMRQGVAWGVGHTLTLMVFGGIVLLLGKAIPPMLARSLEFAVGVMLVVLGVDVLRRLFKQKIHFHAHQHRPDVRHVHAHSHVVEAQRLMAYEQHDQSGHDHVHPATMPWRALMIGMMHGMAGTAALILLSLEAVHSVPMGIAYIALFGLGSVIGMGLLSTVIAIPLRLSAKRLTWLHQDISATFGAFSFFLGATMVYQIGFVDGLLR